MVHRLATNGIDRKTVKTLVSEKSQHSAGRRGNILFEMSNYTILKPILKTVLCSSVDRPVDHWQWCIPGFCFWTVVRPAQPPNGSAYWRRIQSKLFLREQSPQILDRRCDCPTGSRISLLIGSSGNSGKNCNQSITALLDISQHTDWRPIGLWRWAFGYFDSKQWRTYQQNFK